MKFPGSVLRTFSLKNAIESVLKKNSELIAKARFKLEGTSIYPDAAFSPRLSYGSVRGWTRDDGRAVVRVRDLRGLDLDRKLQGRLIHGLLAQHFDHAIAQSFLGGKALLELLVAHHRCHGVVHP